MGMMKKLGLKKPTNLADANEGGANGGGYGASNAPHGEQKKGKKKGLVARAVRGMSLAPRRLVHNIPTPPSSMTLSHQQRLKQKANFENGRGVSIAPSAPPEENDSMSNHGSGSVILPTSTSAIGESHNASARVYPMLEAREDSDLFSAPSGDFPPIEGVDNNDKTMGSECGVTATDPVVELDNEAVEFAGLSGEPLATDYGDARGMVEDNSTTQQFNAGDTEVEDTVGYPMPFIYINADTGEYEIDQSVPAKLVAKIGAMLVRIIAAMGVTRLGKSTMMNWILAYLKANMPGSRLENLPPGLWMGLNPQETSKIGFESQACDRSLTKGIFIWSKPFIVVKENGERIALLIIDTEGTDAIGRTNDDAVITTLTLLLSSCLIFNVKQRLGANDIAELKRAVQYAEMFSRQGLAGHQLQQQSAKRSRCGAPGGTAAKPFQQLVLLVRDYKSPDNPHGFEGGRQYLSKSLPNDLKRYFKSTFAPTCYLAPNPEIGEVVEGWRHADGRLTPFTESMALFIETLFSPECFPLEPKRFNGEVVTCEKLFDLAIRAFHALAKEKGKAVDRETMLMQVWNDSLIVELSNEYSAKMKQHIDGVGGEHAITDFKSLKMSTIIREIRDLFDAKHMGWQHDGEVERYYKKLEDLLVEAHDSALCYALVLRFNERMEKQLADCQQGDKLNPKVAELMSAACVENERAALEDFRSNCKSTNSTITSALESKFGEKSQKGFQAISARANEAVDKANKHNEEEMRKRSLKEFAALCGGAITTGLVGGFAGSSALTSFTIAAGMLGGACVGGAAVLAGVVVFGTAFGIKKCYQRIVKLDGGLESEAASTEAAIGQEVSASSSLSAAAAAMSSVGQGWGGTLPGAEPAAPSEPPSDEMLAD